MSASQDFRPGFALEDKGPTVVVACSALTGIATLFVGARLYVRGRILSRLALDDWLICLSMICDYLALGFTIAAVHAGNGRHFTTLTREQQHDAILYTMIGLCPGIFSFALPKLAIVALLTKIMNPNHKHKIFMWSMTITCTILLFACIPILFGRCKPARSQWNLTVKGTCFNPWILVRYTIVAGALSAVVDLYLAIYPSIVLYKMQISRRKKFGLSTALGLGTIATAIAIYKTTRLPALAGTDFTYDTSDITTWTSIEGNAIIIAACIPTLRLLVEVIFGRRSLGSSLTNSHKRSSSHPAGTNHSFATLKKSGSKWMPKVREKAGPVDKTEAQGSQESILRMESMHAHPSQSSQEFETGIWRAQEVDVTFQNASRQGSIATETLRNP